MEISRERQDASAEQWEQLYVLAARVLEQEPWTELNAINLLVVREEGRAPLYFSVLGNGDDSRLKGVNTYEGEEGLNSWIRTALHENAGLSPEYALQRQNSLAGYLVDPANVSEDMRSQIEATGLDPETELWPVFLSYQPGFYASPPDADEANELIRRYTLFTDIYSQYRASPDTPVPKEAETIECTKNEDGTWNFEVGPLPDMTLQVQHIALENGEFVRRLKYQPQNGRTLQIDAVVPGAPVMDQEYKRLCNPAIIVILDPENEEICGAMAVPPALYPGEGALRALIDFIAQHGVPKEVQVCNLELYAALSDLCSKCGIKLTRLQVLPDMAVAATSLMMALSPKKDGPVYMGLHKGPLS